MLMILLRVLLLLALLWLGWSIWRRIRGDDGSRKPEHIEDMVRCAVCGEHVPKSQSIESEGEVHCRKHADQ